MNPECPEAITIMDQAGTSYECPLNCGEPDSEGNCDCEVIGCR